ncbi:MAG: DUF4411 family protein [Elusimicrobia bacterium]|nr:DUF4411 family protein [Elusimicrobiota bacterium]
MTKTIYFIDACSWSELIRRYSTSKYPAISKAIERLISDGRIISPHEVYNELCLNFGMKDWAQDHKATFRHPSLKEVDALTRILTKLPDAATVNRPYDSDPWLGAFALNHAEEQQGLLVASEKAIVVSEDNKAVKLICDSFHLPQISIFDLLVKEGIVTIGEPSHSRP